MLSVKIYRNFRRYFVYGIYFHTFHAICKGKFQKCDHIYLAIHSHSVLIFRLRCISLHIKQCVSSTHKTTKIHILKYQTLTCTCTVDLHS